MDDPTMLVSERGVRLSAGVFRRSRTLMRPGLRVQVVSTAGCETDTRPIHRAFGSASLPRHAFTVVLAGEYESEPVGRARASEAIYEARSGWMEQWTGAKQRFVVVSWDQGSDESTGGIERLGPAALARWRSLAERIEQATDEDAGSIAHDALEAVRAAGVRPPRVSFTAVPAPVRRIGRAFDHVFTHLHEMPQWIDIESRAGLGARQLRRVLQADAGWLPCDAWRQSLLRYRLSLASSMLGAKDTTAAEVAAALGYRSDRALHTALRRAGLRRADRSCGPTASA